MTPWTEEDAELVTAEEGSDDIDEGFGEDDDDTVPHVEDINQVSFKVPSPVLQGETVDTDATTEVESEVDTATDLEPDEVTHGVK